MSSRRRGVLAVALLVLEGGAAGCDSEPREERTCRCEYVTDTDVPGALDVRVCVARGAEAAAAAAECAQGLGVGHVAACTCSAEAIAPCPGAPCEQAAAR